MTQQKKKSVQAISYSSLHEKLGESQRNNKTLRAQNEDLVKRLKEADEDWDNLKGKFDYLKQANIDSINKLQMALSATVILLCLSILERFM